MYPMFQMIYQMYCEKDRMETYSVRRLECLVVF